MRLASTRHRLVAALLPALLVGAFGLAACGTNGTSSAVTHLPTAAEILRNATTVLNVNGAPSTASTSSATVKDLTFTLKFGIDLKTSSPTLGTEDVTETMTGSGKETLSPRRDQATMTMALALGSYSETITLSEIVDYATQTGYLKFSGLTLPGTSAGKWYKISFASVGGLGADTSLYTDYSKLKNAKLIGSDTIDGVPVWHVRATEDLSQGLGALDGSGSSTGASSSLNMTATMDYYFRQDNYRPVKIVLAASYKDASLGTMTINGEMDFTSFNTGITITLPPKKSVQPLSF